MNTPIILSASASPYHPAMEMTPRGWQFNLPVTDGSYHDSTRTPALSCWLLFLLRDAAGARPAVHPSRLQWCLLSSSLLVLWGEMLPLVYVTLSVPPAHTRSSPPSTYQANYSSIATPSSSHLPVLHNIVEELLIYIFGHDASQLVVVSPSACHWYTPPPPLFF